MNNIYEHMQKLAFGKVVTPTAQPLNESNLKDKIKELVHSSLGEAKKKKKKDVAPQDDTVDLDLSMDAEAPAEEMPTDTITPETPSDIDIDPKIKSVQDYLQKAYANAKELGDEKLMTQIGNTITMVVRNQVLGGQAVAESLNEMKTYSQDELSNEILNDGLGNKSKGTVFFEAWHLGMHSGLEDEVAWNIYSKRNINAESLDEWQGEEYDDDTINPEDYADTPPAVDHYVDLLLSNLDDAEDLSNLLAAIEIVKNQLK